MPYRSPSREVRVGVEAERRRISVGSDGGRLCVDDEDSPANTRYNSELEAADAKAAAAAAEVMRTDEDKDAELRYRYERESLRPSSPPARVAQSGARPQARAPGGHDGRARRVPARVAQPGAVGMPERRRRVSFGDGADAGDREPREGAVETQAEPAAVSESSPHRWSPPGGGGRRARRYERPKVARKASERRQRRQEPQEQHEQDHASPSTERRGATLHARPTKASARKQQQLRLVPSGPSRPSPPPGFRAGAARRTSSGEKHGSPGSRRDRADEAPSSADRSAAQPSLHAEERAGRGRAAARPWSPPAARLQPGTERDIKRGLLSASFSAAAQGSDVEGLWRRHRRGDDDVDALSLEDFIRVVRNQGKCATWRASDEQLRGLYEELVDTQDDGEFQEHAGFVGVARLARFVREMDAQVWSETEQQSRKPSRQRLKRRLASASYARQVQPTERRRRSLSPQGGEGRRRSLSPAREDVHGLSEYRALGGRRWRAEAADTGAVSPRSRWGEPAVAVRKTKLELSPEEKLERQTAAIGKVVRDAIDAGRSIGGKTMYDIEDAFRAIDQDRSGYLDHDEFCMAMNRLGLGLTADQLEQCIEVLDTDDDGEVSLEEFLALVSRPRRRSGSESPGGTEPPRPQLDLHVASSVRRPADDGRGDTSRGADLSRRSGSLSPPRGGAAHRSARSRGLDATHTVMVTASEPPSPSSLDERPASSRQRDYFSHPFLQEEHDSGEYRRRSSWERRDGHDGRRDEHEQLRSAEEDTDEEQQEHEQQQRQQQKGRQEQEERAPPALEPAAIPSELRLAAFLHTVTGARMGAEEARISFQMACRLCELVFDEAFGKAGAPLLCEQMQCAFDAADDEQAFALRGVGGCLRMLHYLVWFNRAWAGLRPLLDTPSDALAQPEFEAAVRGLRMPLDASEAQKAFAALATSSPAGVSADSFCTWAVRLCVARERGWAEEPEQETAEPSAATIYTPSRRGRATGQKAGSGSKGGGVYTSARAHREAMAAREHSRPEPSEPPQIFELRKPKPEPQPEPELEQRSNTSSPAAQSPVGTPVQPLDLPAGQGGDLEAESGDPARTGDEQGYEEEAEEEREAWPGTVVDMTVPALPSRRPPALVRASQPWQAWS